MHATQARVNLPVSRTIDSSAIDLAAGENSLDGSEALFDAIGTTLLEGGVQD
jgi:hypothetical protein